ncbi:unnamed protein product [Mycena citricolor]|uniref:Xylanolytic transcriptional activator regulatory domain-containing protein n=1 Tax=Mycena citricolor TaxID=2018698 RepID=A0AAD2GR25_9AGAR|nr:unnamed protein product [Mycena citricolor]
MAPIRIALRNAAYSEPVIYVEGGKVAALNLLVDSGDGSQQPGSRCSTCQDANSECTYLEGAVKRAPPKNSSYVESLEARLDRSEALVRQLRAELAAAQFAISAPLPSAASETSNGSEKACGPACKPSQAEPLLHIEIAKRVGLYFVFLSCVAHDSAKLEHLTFTEKPEKHFMGKSSGVELMKVTMDMRDEVTKASLRQQISNANSAASSPDLADSPEAVWEDPCPDSLLGWSHKRWEFWNFKPWEKSIPTLRPYVFPEQGFIFELVDLYFQHMNIYYPVFHRPTLERHLLAGLHHRQAPDTGFGAVVLLLCSVASRWSHDPRVGGPTEPGARNLNCGWQWFDQVPFVGGHLFNQGTLYDLQYYVLAVQFLEHACAPQACWTLIGIGLRLAQDMGAHRRMSSDEDLTVERELTKRAFWYLLVMDRSVSAAMGRSCALQYDEFDVDPPIECDDEYWENPERPFQQPPGFPSRVSFFNTVIGLNHLLAFSLKILYPLYKTRTAFNMNGALFEESVVAELDSALNQWLDNVPEHLRWDPMRVDPVFFDQSVALQCEYHHLQIFIHRPFIPMLRKTLPLALPSLTICTNAARACANLCHAQRQRKGDVPVVINLSPIFVAGMVLLLNVWSGKLSDSSRELGNVYKCMEAARVAEGRWRGPGLMWDIFAELATLPQFANRPPASPDHAPRRQSRPHPNPPASVYPESVSASFTPSSSVSPPNSQWAGFDGSSPYVQANEGFGIGPESEFPPFLDDGTIAMWNNAPTTWELGDWGSYLNNFNNTEIRPASHPPYGAI